MFITVNNPMDVLNKHLFVSVAVRLLVQPFGLSCVLMSFNPMLQSKFSLSDNKHLK